MMNSKFLLASIFAIYLAGCTSTSGGGGGAQPGSVPPKSDGGSVPAPQKGSDTSERSDCLKRSCGDSFLLHLSLAQLSELKNDLSAAVPRTQEELERIGKSTVRMKEATVLGADLKLLFPSLDLTDAKTSEAVLWLFSKLDILENPKVDSLAVYDEIGELSRR